jgi:nucleotide-binding universal stress UspA family protein
MYRRILVALENSGYDRAILAHVRQLARMCGASVVLIHVADGFVARNMKQLQLRESEELRKDGDYLDRMAAELCAEGLQAEGLLAAGDPPAEILAAVEREGCDLIAMAMHGHGFLKDVLYGSVVESVRHRVDVPVLLVRGEPGPSAEQG